MVGSKSHKRVHSGHVRVVIIDNGSTDSLSLQFWKLIEGLHFLLCNLLDIFDKWLVSYCCRGQLALVIRCTVMHERFRIESIMATVAVG